MKPDNEATPGWKKYTHEIQSYHTNPLNIETMLLNPNFCAFGGWSLYMKDGKLHQATVVSQNGTACRIRSEVVPTVKNGGAVAVKKVAPLLYEFATKPGASYHIELAP